MVEYRTQQAAIPEVAEISASLSRSLNRSQQKSSRVVHEEIRVHPPDASAAIVQEIREVTPSVELIPNATSRTTYHHNISNNSRTFVNNSRTILHGSLTDSAKNLLASQVNGTSRTNIHYKL